MPDSLSLPGGKRFAFTIFDDCDNSTAQNTRPFYELLERLGMRTTKTVWSFSSPEIHPNWRGSSTLEDAEYKAFAQELQERGFEIASHGASMMSSPRDQTKRALDTFFEAFGHYPRSHANHGDNRDNIYWADTRFRSRLLKALYCGTRAGRAAKSEGHVPDSPYFWGDYCRAHIAYVRGFTFPVTNLLSAHRSVLYRDPSTQFVNLWFSACHAPDLKAFNTLLQPTKQDRLARGGICIVATHAATFSHNDEVNPETRRLLELLASKDGWFVPVSTLLDYLRVRGFGRTISLPERLLIEWRWLRHALHRGIGS